MRPPLVILSAFLSPYRSGAEAMVEEVAPRLSDAFEVTIITSRLSRLLPKSESLRGSVHIKRIGLGFSIDKWIFPILAPFVARRYQPAIIHAVLESYAGLALVFCRWIVPSAKRVLTLQSSNTGFLLGPIHRAPHVITAISRALAERAKSYGRSDVQIIPNGIDFRAIDEARKFHANIPGRVLFVGRLERVKGVDTLLEAFGLLVASYRLPVVHLRIVGDGSECHRLRALSSKLGLDDRVTFVGPVSPINIADEYAQAEVFIGLSRSEGLGNVFLEARAAGCAVIGTNVGGIPDSIQDERTGLLVPPDDPQAASKALERVWTDEALRMQLAQAARQGMEQYDWAVIAGRYGVVLQKML